MTPRITAVFFDLGDTLWHFPGMPSEEVIAGEMISRFSRLLESWGIRPSDELRSLGNHLRIAVAEETRRAVQGDCISPDYPSLCREVASREGLAISDGQAEELWEAWNLGGAFLGRRLFPGALETLHWLRDRGYRLGCVTDRGYGGPRFQAELRDLGLSNLFEVVTCSCNVGYLKPHPRIFVNALEAMDLAPQETAMVGDSLRADIGGAKAMGMVAVWVRPSINEPVEATTDRPKAEGEAVPDYTIDTIAELKGLPIFGEMAKD